MKTIEIIISPTGETRLETKGFSGSECREVSKFVENALGQSSNEELKTEFYQSESAQLKNRQQS